ncbi:MAG: alpha/beta hydrolase [Myxococcales bacterium]
MSRRASELSCLQRTRKRLRRHLNTVVGEGFFGSLSRLGRLHPMASPAKHGVQVIRDVEYLPTGNPRHRLDIYRPAGRSTPLPIVIYIHGGGFHLLSKNTHWLMGLAFARAGYLVFNVDYRLAPEHPYPAAVSDVCDALEWVSHNAEAHGGDLSRLVFAGESAGGNLATALTICCCYRRPEPFAQRAFDTGLVPTAVVPACAPLQVTNPERLNRKRKLPRWVNDILEGINDAYVGSMERPSAGELDLADPLHVFERRERPDRALPAFFVPIGTRDPLLDDTRRLDRALKAMGVECEARYYEGELHAFHALVWRRQARRCWREQHAFLARALQHPREPRHEFVAQA